jgi:hypothetical protein
MTALAPKNSPSPNLLLDPNTHLSFTTFNFVLADGDSQIAYINPQSNSFHPMSVVFTDYTAVTFQVTVSSPAAITANTALWATITLTSNFLSIPSVITGIQVTAASSTVVQAVV